MVRPRAPEALGVRFSTVKREVPISSSTKKPRVNQAIRHSPVRLIDSEGNQLGVVPLEEAREKARVDGLDLVEVGPNADPPVVRILDWGKLRYEREKKARESRRKTHTIEVKEVKFRPSIDTHDFERKSERVHRFLSKGKKVKVTIFFRYRQLRRPELGREILDEVINNVADVGTVETRGDLDGRRMVMVLQPIPLEEREAQESDRATG